MAKIITKKTQAGGLAPPNNEALLHLVIFKHGDRKMEQ
jgi:hypothetical protein